MANDPVCGMEVTAGKISFSYHGEVYYFCSTACLDKFKKNPTAFKSDWLSLNHLVHHQHMAAEFKRRFWISLVLTMPIFFFSPAVQRLIGIEKKKFSGQIPLLLLFSSAVFIYGGYPFLKGMFEEIKVRNPGMMTLVAVAIIVAYLYSSMVAFGLKGEVFFWELATLIDVMLLGHWVEMKSVMSASKSLQNLAELLPPIVHKILPNGMIVETPLREISAGDRLLIKPGEKIPADGEVVEGETFVDEALLTGESKPVHKKQGAKVVAGSINSECSITMEVKQTGKESFLFRIIELVKTAQQSKSRTQNLADRAGFWLTIISLSVGIITLIAWLVLLKKDFAFAIGRAVTVMVITCPHALGLAVPLVVSVSTTLAARNGLLIRNRTSFEKARNINAVVFDKTGTLTEGRFGITNTLLFSEEIDIQTLTRYAASIERHSEHPIAQGITASVKEFLPVESFKAIPGKGVEGKIDGKTVRVVGQSYLEEKSIKVESFKLASL